MFNEYNIIVNVMHALIPKALLISGYLGDNKFACKMRSSCIVKFSMYKFEW